MNLTEKANEQRCKLSREFSYIQEKKHLGTATTEDADRLSLIIGEYRELLKDPNSFVKG